MFSGRGPTEDTAGTENGGRNPKTHEENKRGGAQNPNKRMCDGIRRGKDGFAIERQNRMPNGKKIWGVAFSMEDVKGLKKRRPQGHRK